MYVNGKVEEEGETEQQHQTYQLTQGYMYNIRQRLQVHQVSRSLANYNYSLFVTGLNYVFLAQLNHLGIQNNFFCGAQKLLCPNTVSSKYFI